MNHGEIRNTNELLELLSPESHKSQEKLLIDNALLNAIMIQ
jgi:hypothetical protein